MLVDQTLNSKNAWNTYFFTESDNSTKNIIYIIVFTIYIININFVEHIRFK